MKAIHLHGPATDATGAFHDAGTELTVLKDAKKAGTVDEAKAKELVKQGRAVAHGSSPAQPRPVRSSARRSRTKAAVKKPATTRATEPEAATAEPVTKPEEGQA